MNLSVSNIAWAQDDEPQVALKLRELRVTGVEVAPTMVWRSPTRVSPQDLQEYRRFWESHGMRIVALQALLFGREDLQIFTTPEVRQETSAYLKRIIELAHGLGAKALVFGSPANRRVGDMDRAEARRIAIPFFRDLGLAAADAGVWFCIEPNPPAYGCDYLLTVAEVLEVLREADSPGLGINLDTGIMTMMSEQPEAAVAAALPWARHFHISEPQLAPTGTRGADHARFGAALRADGYTNWVSIEMRRVSDVPAVVHVENAVRVARAHYGGPAVS